jgi:hypothetical protein
MYFSIHFVESKVKPAGVNVVVSFESSRLELKSGM